MPTVNRWLFSLCFTSALACSVKHIGREADSDPTSTERDAAGAHDDLAEEPGAADATAPPATVSEQEASLDASALSADASSDAPSVVADADAVVDANAIAPRDASTPHAGDSTLAPTGGDAAPPVSTPSCLADSVDYKERGPFAFRSEQDGKTQLFVPQVSGPGCKLPIVHFGVGTGASCSNYLAVLEHLASHGFLTTCHDSPTAQPAHCVLAIDAAQRLHPELAGDALGFAGQHTGAAAAYACVQQAEQTWGHSRRYAGYAAAPASGTGEMANWRQTYAKVRSPMFQFHGSEDVLVSRSWVQQSYDALPDATEAYWFEARGAPHIPLPIRYMQESSVVFFRWKLLGDARACAYFSAMQRSDDWALAGQQNAVECPP